MLCLSDYDCETLCRILTVLGSTASLLPSAVISTLIGEIDHIRDCLHSSVLNVPWRSNKKLTLFQSQLKQLVSLYIVNRHPRDRKIVCLGEVFAYGRFNITVPV